MICIVYIITGIFGPDIWTIDLFELNLTSLGYGYYKVDTSIIYTIIGLTSLYFNIASAMFNVSKHYKKSSTNNSTNGDKDGSTKDQISQAYRGLYPFSFIMDLFSYFYGFIHKFFMIMVSISDIYWLYYCIFCWKNYFGSFNFTRIPIYSISNVCPYWSIDFE